VRATVGLRVASSLERLGTETAFSVLARAKELERAGIDVIHLEIGEPDFDTPAHVSDAACEAIRAGDTHYCPSAGLAELREAAADYLGDTRGIAVAPERVLIGTGAKPFLFFGVFAVCDPGDEVIYPDPGFPIYESAIRFVGATPVPLPLHEERDFSFDLDELAALLNRRTKLVILNSPQNPTGGVIRPDDIASAAQLIAETDAWVLSDEVYSQLVYEDEFASIAAEPAMLGRTILLDGCSKTFAMTGWRCGFAAVPEPLVDPLVRFFVNSTSCVPPFVQHAAVAALRGSMDEPRAMLEEFRRRRDMIVGGLNSLPGVACRVPAGAFYVFPSVAGVCLPAEDFARRLLDEAGVAVLAGSAFGRVGCDNLRLAYANSQENLGRAIERMRVFLDTL
jgi:aspartate/methionine/tyrosine aminotransferase